MFYDYSLFPFLKPIKDSVKVIANEYLEAEKSLNELKFFFKNEEMPPVYSHFDYWVKESGFDTNQIGYDSRGQKPVGGFPLYKKGFPIKWMDVSTIFPETYKLLMNVPNIHFAQFSIMSPDAFILPHAHQIDSKIFHLNLFELNGKGTFKAGNETIEYSKQGDCFLFNPTDVHSSKNSSSSFRVTLMFDFRY